MCVCACVLLLLFVFVCVPPATSVRVCAVCLSNFPTELAFSFLRVVSLGCHPPPAPAATFVESLSLPVAVCV